MAGPRRKRKRGEEGIDVQVASQSSNGPGLMPQVCLPGYFDILL
jgi:hypothetical protein